MSHATGHLGVAPRLPVPAGRRRPTREERRLSARLRRRDRSVLADLYDQYGRATFGFLVGAVGRDSAEDVQQQVFLEAWQRGAEYDPSRSAPSTWLMTIARSRAIDHLRRRRPEPRDPALLAETPTESALDELHDRWWLSAVLSQLPGEEAELLRLRFAHGLTQSEIAEAVGLPLGTVKTRMARALSRLRPLLDEQASTTAAWAKERT